MAIVGRRVGGQESDGWCKIARVMRGVRVGIAALSTNNTRQVTKNKNQVTLRTKIKNWHQPQLQHHHGHPRHHNIHRER